MLPLALLGIWTSLKEDIKDTAAELIYGTSLRLPGEFFVHPVDSSMDPTSYITQLKSTMQSLRSMPTRKLVTATSHIDSSLHSTSHVFVRHDAVKKPLQQPHNGPYRVLDRAAKFYTLDFNGRKDTVSIDRLKPAHLDTPALDSYPDTTVVPDAPSPTPHSSPVSSTPCSTRSTWTGRQVRWPTYLQDFVVTGRVVM